MDWLNFVYIKRIKGKKAYFLTERMCHRGEPLGSFSRWTWFHFLVLICCECQDRRYSPIFIHELFYEWLHSICGDSWRCKMLARRILPLNTIYKGSHMQPCKRGQGKTQSSKESRHFFICTKKKPQNQAENLQQETNTQKHPKFERILGTGFFFSKEIFQKTFQENQD